MPTFDRTARFAREYARLPRELREAFRQMLPLLVAALQTSPPLFPPGPRVRRVQGTDGVWEVTFAPDGRATFHYGDEIRAGDPHVVWRRVGTHDVLREP